MGNCGPTGSSTSTSSSPFWILFTGKTIGDDGLVRRADVGDEPFDVVERDLFGAAEQYTYAVAETVVVFLEETE